MDVAHLTPGDSPAHRQPVAPAVLREEDAARYIGRSRAFLKRARREGRGPAVVRIGRSIVYRLVDLDAWLEAHVVRFA